jgi:hypothetical protein
MLLSCYLRLHMLRRCQPEKDAKGTIARLNTPWKASAACGWRSVLSSKKYRRQIFPDLPPFLSMNIYMA